MIVTVKAARGGYRKQSGLVGETIEHVIAGMVMEGMIGTRKQREEEIMNGRGVLPATRSIVGEGTTAIEVCVKVEELLSILSSQLCCFWLQRCRTRRTRGDRPCLSIVCPEQKLWLKGVKRR